MSKLLKLATIGLGLTLIVGCGPSFTPKARNGIIFYCPGAGNIDFGDTGIRDGLESVGYRGDVATVTWTVSLNPAIDQAVKVNANLGGRKLARWIEQYSDEYPGRPINVIGLSAGTGVALYACEDLKRGYSVDNVVLLSGSISHDYDVRPALRNIKGKIYNYYSPKDAVLAGPMKVFGTIDGKMGVEGAGAVGLSPPGGRERVVNIRWRPEFQRYGYYGGHLDVTSPAFVRAQIAPNIMTKGGAPVGQYTTVANGLAQAPPAAHRD